MDRNHNNLTARIYPPLVFFLLAFQLIMPSISIALDCNNPPRGFGGSWARAYKNWCESCGGTYSSRGPSCNPGPNWGGGSRGGSSYQQPSYDYEAERQRQEEERFRQEEAERQRQRELEEQRKREEEETRRKQAEFERSKQEALKSMKGVGAGELGLKGSGTGELGLKGIGDKGTSGLGLKGMEDTSSQKPLESPKVFSEQPSDKRQKGIEALQKHIPERKKDKAVTKKSKEEINKGQKVWQKALGCAMEEVYIRVESLGPAGKQFSQDLRKEMKRVFKEAGKSVKDINDVNVVNFGLDRQISAGSGSSEGQFIVKGIVNSKGNGKIFVDVQSYFSKSADKKDKQEYMQSVFEIDNTGKIIQSEKSAAVDACLAH